MGWGQGIGIGWPNASASATPVPQESYYFYNCVAEEQNNSNPYPIGSFLVGDRILINEGSNYGYIIEAIPESTSSYTISSLPIGYTGAVCIDSNVSLTSSLILTPGQLFEYSIELNGTENFGQDIPVISNGDLNYEITVRIHYEASFNSGALIKTGFVDIITNTYNIPGGATANISTVFAFNLPAQANILEYYNYYIDPLTIQNTYGPYHISDGYSQFLTDNGNAWSFNWPSEF